MAATAALSALAAAALCAALWASPPELVRIGANYTAKIVCSNVFLASRDPEEVLRVDVQAAGHPLLRLMRVSVDKPRGIVHAGLFGFIGDGLAVARPGQGCAVMTQGMLRRGVRPFGGEAAPGVGIAPRADAGVAPMRPAAPTAPSTAEASPAAPADRSALPWPEGETVASDGAVERVLANDVLTGPGMRAVVAIHGGALVGERYAAGFAASSPLLGWSMTKSVTAILVGLLVKDGRLHLDQSAGWVAGDPRAGITVAQLLSMSSGLQFDEGYAAVSDLTRMLYEAPDMAAFVQTRPAIHPPGTVWSYSSGSAVLVARLVQDAWGSNAPSLLRQRLFDRLGMAGGTLETDARGTWVGSSYLYATARDWGRLGWLLAQDGRWNGEQVLPPGYVAMMSAPVAASGGEYGQGMVWRYATHPQQTGDDPNAAYGIPGDAFWMSGHDGQYVAIVPSRGWVVVRLGLTPAGDRYRPEPLVAALLAASP